MVAASSREVADSIRRRHGERGAIRREWRSAVKRAIKVARSVNTIPSAPRWAARSVARARGHRAIRRVRRVASRGSPREPDPPPLAAVGGAS